MGKVIHEETRRVWRFEDGTYFDFNEDERPVRAQSYEDACNLTHFPEKEAWLRFYRNGRPITIKITVEEVDP